MKIIQGNGGRSTDHRDFPQKKRAQFSLSLHAIGSGHESSF